MDAVEKAPRRGGFREWVWRSEALRAVRATRAPQADRHKLALAHQRGEAAESLWNSGHAAEAIRLAVDAFRVMEGLPSDDDTIVAMGGTQEDQRAVAQARKALEAEPPLLDEDAVEIAADFYVDVRDGRRALQRLYETQALGSAGVLRQRIVRSGVLLVMALGLLGALIAVATRRPPPDVTASATYPGPDFVAQHACDGNPESEWLLPDGANGWIECQVAPAADVSSVRLTNGRNQSYGDRGVKEYTVKLLRGTEVIAEHEGVFERIESSPRPVAIPITGEGVTAVRVEVRGHHRRGAALAEITWR